MSARFYIKQTYFQGCGEMSYVASLPCALILHTHTHTHTHTHIDLFQGCFTSLIDLLILIMGHNSFIIFMINFNIF